MPDPGYLEANIGRGWEVWMSSDERVRWTVELVRFGDSPSGLGSRPRPLGSRVFKTPQLAVKAVRTILFGETSPDGKPV
jgi:hypothetical protein